MEKNIWTTIAVTKGMAKRIREVIKHYDDFRSVQEYVRRATSRRLEYHETEIRVRKDIEEGADHGG